MTELTYYAVVRDLDAAAIRERIRRGLRYCPTCHAAGPLPCKTASGRVARDHRGRA